MAYDIFQLVLDFRQDPSHFGDLIGPDKPLPEDLGKLLEEVAAMQSADGDGGQPEALVSATAFFIERVLFMPGGDYYRHLGVDRHATQEQIRKHYHLLMHLFMLDREDMADDWSAEFAEHINRAYSILRDPAKRREYDARLAGLKPPSHNRPEHANSEKSFARSIVSFARARHHAQAEPKPSAAGGSEPPSRPAPVPEAAATGESIAVNSAVAPLQEEESFIADSIERAYSDVGARVGPVEEASPSHVSVSVEATDADRAARIKPILPDEDLGSGVEAAYQRHSQSHKSSRWGIILVSLLVVLGGVAAVYEYQIAPGELSALFNGEFSPMVTDSKTQQVAVARPEFPSVAREREAQPEPESTQRDDGPLALASPIPDDPVAEPEPEPEPVMKEPVVGEDIIKAEPAREESSAPQPAVVEEKQAVVEGGEESEPIVTGLTLSPRRTSRIPETPAPVRVPSAMQEKVEALVVKPVVPADRTEKVVTGAGQAADRPEVKAVPAARSSAPVAVPVEQAAPPVMAAKVDPTPPTVNTVPSVSEVAPVTASRSGTELAGVVPPPPVMEPPPIEPFPQEALDSLMRTFVRSYEEGDLRRLLSVFAQDAHTNDRNDRQGIAEDYRELFGMTEKRQFIVDDLAWTQIDDDHAKGEGEFEVKVLLKGETSITTVRGQVEIDVEKRGRDLLITRFFHTYE